MWYVLLRHYQNTLKYIYFVRNMEFFHCDITDLCEFFFLFFYIAEQCVYCSELYSLTTVESLTQLKQFSL